MKPPNNRDKGSFEPVLVGFFFFFERFFFLLRPRFSSPSAAAASSASSSAASAASSFASASSAPSSVAAGASSSFSSFSSGCRGLAALGGRGGVERLLLFFVARVVLGHWCWLCAIAGALAALSCEPCYWYACTVACKVQHSLLVERSSLDCSRLEELSLLQPRTAGLWRAAWTVYEQFANEPQNAIS